MTIEKIEDIIIPKKEIGHGTDWENEIHPILKGYADFLGDDMATPTPDEQIIKCENNLKTTLPADLKLFYKKFGPAKLQETLLDVNDFCFLTNDWGQQLLDHYNQEEQQILSKLIVFGTYLDNGDVWCFHSDTKEIFFYKHDCKPNINGMFKTFGQYLQSLLVFTQQTIADEELHKPIENIVVQQIGQQRVKVWQYYSGWE